MLPLVFEIKVLRVSESAILLVDSSDSLGIVGATPGCGGLSSTTKAEGVET